MAWCLVKHGDNYTNALTRLGWRFLLLVKWQPNDLCWQNCEATLKWGQVLPSYSVKLGKESRAVTFRDMFIWLYSVERTGSPCGDFRFGPFPRNPHPDKFIDVQSQQV